MLLQGKTLRKLGKYQVSFHIEKLPSSKYPFLTRQKQALLAIILLYLTVLIQRSVILAQNFTNFH
jgi:hypothetical protein